MKAQLKKMIYGTPILGPLTQKAWRGWNKLRLPFSTSGDYWEQRYRKAGNSGAGSYGRLAEFKAEVLNEFVARHGVKSVIELGSGDGNQLTLSDYNGATYLGLDISRTAIDVCQKRFASDPLKAFRQYDSAAIRSHLKEFQCEMSMSLDVIYHLVEDTTFDDYMQSLFACASRFVVIYSSDKQDGTKFEHVRHRKFTDWVKAHQPDWSLCRKLPNRYPLEEGREDDTSFADFFFFAKKNTPDAFAVAATPVPNN